MKTLLKLGALALCLSAINAHLTTCFAQGTAFTYQGRLNDGATPANGSYDLRFALFNAASGGAQQGAFITNTATAVTNGLFTVTLDFGSQFNSGNRWLELAVQTNGGTNFVILAPRQNLTANPYAVRAATAAVADSVNAANMTGTIALAQLPTGVLTNGGNFFGNFTGDGSGLTNVGVANAWQLGGNNVVPSQFLGSTNNQPLEIRVKGERAMRIEYAQYNDAVRSPNIIFGWASNSVADGAIGTVIAGGGISYSGGDQRPNSSSQSFSFIGGGFGNTITSNSFGGITPQGGGAVIVGGYGNSIEGPFSSFIGGGEGNLIRGESGNAFIGGGADNAIQNANFSTVLGGLQNKINNSSVSTIGGGYGNLIGTNSGWATISGGQANVIQSSSMNVTIGGGFGNQIETNVSESVISGGRANRIQAYNTHATIGGGWANIIQTGVGGGVIAGGYGNTIVSSDPLLTTDPFPHFSTIGGGNGNSVSGSYAIVPGGLLNSAAAYSFAAGTRARAIHRGTFVWADYAGIDFSTQRTNEFAVRASGGVRLVTGGAGLTLDGLPIAPVANTVTNNAIGVTLNGAFGGSFSGIVSGNHSGNGSALTNLNATNLVGTLSPGQLPSSVIYNLASGISLNGVFFGSFFGGADLNGNFSGSFSGDGSGLTNLPSVGGGGGVSYFGVTNVLLGSVSNSIMEGVEGATVSGGGTTNYIGLYIGATYGASYGNAVNGHYGTVGGGYGNSSSNEAATVSGGALNNAAADFATISGGAQNTVVGNYSAVGGGTGNSAYNDYATLAGGLNNSTWGNFAAIGGGENNYASYYCAVGGGSHNLAGGGWSTICGGWNNYAGNSIVSIGGGTGNNGYAYVSTIGGGLGNQTFSGADYSTIAGGSYNAATNGAIFATIPGGDHNVAASYAFAAGRRAQAIHTGSFVWADSTDAEIASSGSNEFTVRASGGTRIFSDTNATAGVSLAAGGTAWAVISDRNAKKDFAPINAVDILEKLAAMPVTQWRYNWETEDTTLHIGPMAQDFKAAFYPGSDDKSITTLEADGVAFAAIQGLNQKLEEQKAENAELKARLEKLERLLQQK